MLEHIPGLPDLILFWMNDVSVIRVSRCGITRGTLSGQHVLTFKLGGSHTPELGDRISLAAAMVSTARGCRWIV